MMDKNYLSSKLDKDLMVILE